MNALMDVLKERKVETQSDFLVLDPAAYCIINNAYISWQNTTTTIDRLVVSIYGLFIIEVLDNVGRVYGDESSKYWTELKGSEKSRFNNPLQESYRKAQLLKNFLGLPASCFHFVVCFKEAGCKLQMPHPENVMIGSPTSHIESHKTRHIDVKRLPKLVAAIQRPFFESSRFL